MWRRMTSISQSERRWARRRRRFPTAACGGTTRRRRCSSPNGRPFWQRPARPTVLWPTGGAGAARIGRAAWRGRGEISVGGGLFKKKKEKIYGCVKSGRKNELTQMRQSTVIKIIGNNKKVR